VELVTILKRLGFGEYEARVLAALARLEDATVPEIARESGVPRTKAYDVLEKLVRSGMVALMEGRPRRYVLPGGIEALRRYVKRKREEIVRLEEELDRIKVIGLAHSKTPQNYTVHVPSSIDPLSVVRGKPVAVVYTIQSWERLKALSPSSRKGPLDVVITEEAAYVFLTPVGIKGEHTVVVFRQRELVDLLMKWARGGSSNDA